MSTEHNISLLAEVMFMNCNSSLLRRHTTNQFFISMYAYTSADHGRALTSYAAFLWVLRLASPDLNNVCHSILIQSLLRFGNVLLLSSGGKDIIRFSTLFVLCVVAGVA